MMQSLRTILLVSIFETVTSNMTSPLTSSNDEEYNTYIVYNTTKHTNNTWETVFKKKSHRKKELYHNNLADYILSTLIVTAILIGLLLYAIYISDRNWCPFRINECISSCRISFDSLRLFFFFRERPTPAPPAPPAPQTVHELPELFSSA